MAIEKIDQDLCTGCRTCLSCCPQDVIRMDENSGKAIIKYPEDCMACWACESFCPVDCIEVSKDRAIKMPSPYLGVY